MHKQSMTIIRHSNIPLLLLLLTAILFTRGYIAFGATERLAIGIDAISNNYDGSVLDECKTQHETESGKKHEMWISFGRVKPQKDQGWKTVSSNTHCGNGSFNKSGAHVGFPYLVADIETIPSVGQSQKTNLQTKLLIRKFSGFNDKGQPVLTL